MSLFRFTWLRNFIRRNTNQIPEDSAEFWKNKLSLGYMFLAWNAFGFVMFNMYKGNSDWGKKYKTDEENALTPAQYFARLLGIQNAKVYKVSGFNVSQYEIHNEDDGLE